MNDALHNLAEEIAAQSPKNSESLSPEAARQTLHDLHVHQIELEMQNEELRRAQVELDIARARYFDLYDLAPAGYVTVGETGLIQEANLTTATLLGVARGTLIKCPFSRFMIREDADNFYRLCGQLFETGAAQSCDLRMVKGDGTPFWAHLAAITALNADGVPECRITLSDITERKQMENRLTEEVAHRRIMIEQSRDGIVVLDHEGKVFETNRRFAEMLGYTPEEVLQLHVWDWDTQWTREELLGMVGEADASGARFETRHRLKDGSFCDVEICSNGFVYGERKLVFCVCRDITERKRAETYREMGMQILTVLNEGCSLHQSVQRVVSILKAQTGFDAVGLRLQDGEDFPYFAEDGLSADFLLKENTLARRGPDGGVCRDKDGKVCLEGMCGLVLSGTTDPAHPLFTRGGSFWTNDAFPLLVLPSEEDPRLNPRNECLHQGYASVALIPIRAKGDIVGLIHLNDRRKGRFVLSSIELLEDIASHIGSALMRTRTEEKLRKSDEQFRTLAEVSSAGIYLCDIDGGCLYTNPAWRDMAGLSSQEALGKGWVAGLHPEDRGQISASWQHMVESHGRWGLEYRFQTREGKVTWVYGVAAPQYDASGKIVQYVGINLDISERKRLDDVQSFLAQTSSGGTKEPFFSELARYLAQSLNMDFVCVDRLEGDGLSARTVAVWCDGRFDDNVTYALKDTPCGDVVGKQVCCFPANVCQYFPRDQVLKDLRAESYVGVTLIGHTGKPVGLIAVIGRSPLTNRPLVEAVLKLVAVRAAGEIERQDFENELQRMQKLQSVGTLAGGIAHDFNNILLGLFGNISLAKDELERTHPAYALFEDAEISMNRAVRLTKQLLTFAKGGDPVKEDVGLGELAEEVARFDLSGSNVRLVYRRAEDLWQILADKGQIQQVVSNLVINARQAMPAGGQLQITLENDALSEEAVAGLRQGRYVKVKVRDEGVGIDPKQLDRIFDPYFTTKQSGSGLGLATVWSIINKHGGHIGVKSELSKGTTFTFYLPASATPLPAQKQFPAECPPTPCSAKILFMDDEESVSKLVTRILTRCGYSVTTAPNGAETLKLYEQAMATGEPFDAVIMDLTIPGGIGGKEVIKDLLVLDPLVRAIVSSGYADDRVMANPTRYGFMGTVAKPYTARALCETVAQVLA